MATFLCIKETFYEGPFSWRNAVQVDLPSPIDFAQAAEQAVSEFVMGDDSIDIILLVKQQTSGEIRRFRVERHVQFMAFRDNTVQPPKEDINASV